jgi:sporulation protein YlmC with PRC-barrel domain
LSWQIFYFKAPAKETRSDIWKDITVNNWFSETVIYIGMCWKSMLHINNLLGKTVVSAVGTYVGEVYDIDVDSSTWSVKSLHVKLSDKAIEALGLKKFSVEKALGFQQGWLRK